MPPTGTPTHAGQPCGDGVLDAGETCDDGNTANGDGCSSTCAVEPWWSCQSGGSASANAGSPYCQKWRVRRDIKSLTDAERDLYISALTAFYAQANTPGVSTNYHYFVALHQSSINTNFAHGGGGGGFLPWHRKYLVEFENALRAMGGQYADITIPYWDWAEWSSECIAAGTCTHLTDLSNGQKIFTDSAFGTQGTTWADNTPFNSVTTPATGATTGWMQNPQPGTSNYIDVYRDMQAGNNNIGGSHAGANWGTGGNWNGPVTGQTTLQLIMEEDDEYFIPGAGDPRVTGGVPRTSKGFWKTVEGAPHGWVHVATGGTMAHMSSPADPIFWSHHAFVDKLWSIWQDCHGYDEVDTQASPACATGSTPCEFPKHFVSSSDWNSAMPMDQAGVNAAWGATRPPTWDTARTAPRHYMKIQDLGSSSYMYEMDEFDKHMGDSALLCSMDWHGFAVQQTQAGLTHPVHFAASAAAVSQMALPLNLDEAVNPDRSTFDAFYAGAMCSVDPSKAFNKVEYLAKLSDAAFRECSALAATLGEAARYTPFPLGSVVSPSDAMSAWGPCHGVRGSPEIVDSTIAMNTEGMCQETRTREMSCQLTGGQWVPSAWVGPDSGANSCNSCTCADGTLACSKLSCDKGRIAVREPAAPAPKRAARAVVKTDITLAGMSAGDFTAKRAQITAAIARTLGVNVADVVVTVKPAAGRRRLGAGDSVTLHVEITRETEDTATTAASIDIAKGSPTALIAAIQTDAAIVVTSATVTDAVTVAPVARTAEGAVEIRYIPDPNCYKELSAATCTLKQHTDAGGQLFGTVSVAHNKHKCRMTAADTCSCDQHIDTTAGTPVGATHLVHDAENSGLHSHE